MEKNDSKHDAAKPEADKPAPPAEAKPEPAPAAPLHEWPGAFGLFNPSRVAVRRNLSTIVLLLVLALAAGVLIGIIFGRVRLLNDLVSWLVGAVFTGAQVLTYVASVRGRQIEIADSINEALPVFFKLFVLNLLVAATIIGGLILFIVPALFILPRLVLAQYFLMDKKMGVIEAYSASWRATKGHAGKVWGIIGVVFLMILPSLTVILIPLTVYWVVMYSSSTALLYQFILDHPAPDSVPAT